MEDGGGGACSPTGSSGKVYGNNGESSNFGNLIISTGGAGGYSDWGGRDGNRKGYLGGTAGTPNGKAGGGSTKNSTPDNTRMGIIIYFKYW